MLREAVFGGKRMLGAAVGDVTFDDRSATQMVARSAAGSGSGLGSGSGSGLATVSATVSGPGSVL